MAQGGRGLGSQGTGEGYPEQETQHREHKAQQHRREEAGGGHLLRLPQLLAAEGPGDEVAGSVAVVKADGLDDVHQRQHHPHRRHHAVLLQMADEEGVRQVIEGGHQHADDGGDGQAVDQLLHRLGGHADKFFFLGAVKAPGLLAHRLSLPCSVVFSIIRQGAGNCQSPGRPTCGTGGNMLQYGRRKECFTRSIRSACARWYLPRREG